MNKHSIAILTIVLGLNTFNIHANSGWEPVNPNTSPGVCNGILGQNLGLVQQIDKGGIVAGAPECTQLLLAFQSFAQNGCLTLFNQGKLFIKDGSETPLVYSICNALSTTCQLPLPSNICDLPPK
jgi:hypothetical protein